MSNARTCQAILTGTFHALCKETQLALLYREGEAQISNMTWSVSTEAMTV